MRPIAQATRRFLPVGWARGGGPGRRATRPAVTGDLALFGLAEIVQTLTLGMKTACLSLSQGERRGKIWFENGATRHAWADGRQGEAAFYEVMRWTSGQFAIEYGIVCWERTLSEDALYLLMEGFRRIDESAPETRTEERRVAESTNAALALTTQMHTELEELFNDLTGGTDEPRVELPSEVLALHEALGSDAPTH